MADPVTIGTLVAGALGMAGEAIFKGAVGEAAKDAYKALKAKVSAWAAGDVTELTTPPQSDTRKAVMARAVHQLPAADQESLRQLAHALARNLKADPPAIGLDIGRLRALEAQLGNSTVTRGIGSRIRDADVP